MNVIYDTAPRTPAASSTQQASCLTVPLIKKIGESMRALAEGEKVESTIRIKRIDYFGAPAYVLKNNRNRMRIILIGEVETIRTLASMPAIPQMDSPYLPLYPIESAEACEKRVFAAGAPGIALLAQYCKRQMLKATYYSADNFACPFVSNQPDAPLQYAQVQAAHQVVKNNQAYWAISALLGTLVKHYVVRVEAIRYDEIRTGYYLVYKNEFEADVMTRNELCAFYRVEGRYQQSQAA
jgi:hypothetical protein